MIVNFFVVGTQKAGTTALDRHLRSCPGLLMASVKEVHFFDDDDMDWSNPDYARLHGAFSPEFSSGMLRGEATPIYSYWPDALDRLHRYNPRAKLIMGLRHPTFRAFSHWRMEVERGAETYAFGDAIRETGRRRVALAPHGVHRVFSYVERGFYAEQVKRMFRLFPRDQLLFYRTDMLWRTPRAVLDQIAAFLQVEAIPDGETTYQGPSSAHDGLKPPVADRHLLNALYIDDIEQTARLTDLALGDWLDSSYGEPMQPDRRRGSGDRRTIRHS